MVHAILERKPNADVIVTGILPRDKHISCRYELIKNVNQNLKSWFERNTNKNVHLLLPNPDWVMPNRNLNEKLYYKDCLQLSEMGNHKLAETLYDAINKILEKQSRPYKLKVLSETNPPATTILISNSTITLTNTKALTTQQQNTYSTKTADYINTTNDIVAMKSNSTIALTGLTVSVPLTKQLNTAITNTKNTKTTNTSNITSTTGTNMTCTDLNTNTCTDTSTDLRSKTQMTTYTTTHIGFSTDIHNGSLTNTRTATGTDIYTETHTVPCIDTNTNSHTATQTNSPTETNTNTSDTNRRICRKKNQFYNFYIFCVYIYL